MSDSPYLAPARAAAAAAAQFIAERALARHEIVWEEKSANDFVSAVDIGAEERIRAHLERALPGISILGEELGTTGDATSGLVAVVDPLDGTTNFLHGVPAYAVSIGILLDGVLQAGVVHDVARGGVYYASRGGGAWVDGDRLQVSTTERPLRALLATGFPFRSETGADQYVRQLRRLMPLVSGVRRAGAAALDLADVARGRFDAFWELELAPWDIAAGILLIREAGGIVTDLAGNEAPVARGPIVASNGVMHEWLLRELQVGS